MSDNGRKTGPRCIAIVGPFASGKTSLLEAILARTGAIDKPGSVTNGTAIGDSSPEARAHSMSVELNVAETEFMGDTYTFIDCPGSVEFGYESEPLVGGIDAAIVVAEPDEKKVPALQVVLKHLEERRTAMIVRPSPCHPTTTLRRSTVVLASIALKGSSSRMTGQSCNNMRANKTR